MGTGEIEAVARGIERTVNERMSANILTRDYNDRVRMVNMALGRRLAKELVEGNKNIMEVGKMSSEGLKKFCA